VLVLKESRRLRYFTFCFLYIMQGLPAGFRADTIYNYLVEKGLTAEAVGSFVFLVGLPWSFQFVWGPVVDRFQVSVIGQRKQWVVLTQLVAVAASLGLLVIRDPVAELGLMSALFLVHSLFASIQDTSVDAMAIGVTPEAERGRLNALMRIGFLLGTSLGAAGLAPVLHHYGFQRAALLQSGVLLFFTVLTFFIRLDRTDRLLPAFLRGARARQLAARQQARQATLALTPTLAPEAPTAHNQPLWTIFQELARSVWQPRSLRIYLCVWAVYLASTVFYSSYKFTLLHDLHYRAQAVSIIEGSWVNLLAVVVLLAGGWVSDRLGAVRLQRGVLVFVSLVFLTISALHGSWAQPAVGNGGLVALNLIDPFMSVAALPLLMNLCDKRVAGSQFTAYMALINFGDVLGAKINGWALSFTTAPMVGVGCAAIVLLSFWNLRRVRAEVPVSEPRGNLAAA